MAVTQQKLCISCLFTKHISAFKKPTDRVCKQCKAEMKAAGVKNLEK